MSDDRPTIPAAECPQERDAVGVCLQQVRLDLRLKRRDDVPAWLREEAGEVRR